ncbi:hypothetical protein GP486_007363 [Trichoglossum hirsutum]|uniref:Uncharacterized protein n=1 Tax=Trichoglossum hirsutum TaxID=265104 RepID=A0A9P8II95_9PEZI|nr:hypothetical protein GP486_007363 [Trichoglossum hirsutum]
MAGGVKIKLKPKAIRHSTDSGLTLDTSRLEKVATSLPYQQSPSSNSIHIHPIPFASELDHFSPANHKLPLTANSGSTWRRPSNSLAMPSTVKRSASTPNVRGQAAADAAGLSFADKRRNKLGYHRTSVACAPIVPKAFDYLNGIERPSAWDATSTFTEQAPISATDKPGLEDPTSNFWRLAESPITPSPYSSIPLQASISAVDCSSNANGFSPEVPRDMTGWPLPLRSMSLGHLGQVGSLQSPAVSYLNNFGYENEYKSNAVSELYPSSVNTSTASFTASISEPASAPAEGQFVLQPGWSTTFGGTHEVNGKPLESYTSWYEDTGHLAQVDEESQAPHFNETTPIFFHDGPQSAI